jgi:hypothetical protein
VTCEHPALSTREARLGAAAARARGEDVEARSCDACGEWVIAEPRTLDELEAMALAIRERSGNAPGVRGPEHEPG